MNDNPNILEHDVHAIGEKLHRLALQNPTTLFDPKGIRRRILLRILNQESLRVTVLQLLEVLPALDDDELLARHLRSYLEPYRERLGGVFGRLISLDWTAPNARTLRTALLQFAGELVAAENPPSLAGVIQGIGRLPAGITLAPVMPPALTDEDGERYGLRQPALLELLSQAGPLPGRPPISLSITLSALIAHLDPLDYAGVRRRVLAHLQPLLALLRQTGGALTVEMERYELKDTILALFRDLVDAEGDGSWRPGITLQAYLPDTERDLKNLTDWARNRGHRIAVRLIKGAHRDTELALALQRNWTPPVFADPSATDAQYERLADRLFEQPDRLYPVFGSHSLRAIAYTLARAARTGLTASDFEIEMQYGVAEPLARAVAALNGNLRIRLPTGDPLTALRYLARHLLEEAGNATFLSQPYLETRNLARLLAEPTPPAPPPEGPRPPFGHTPLRDFSLEPVRTSFATVLSEVRSEAGKQYLLSICGAPHCGAEWRSSRNPARPEETLGHVAMADLETVRCAVDNARHAFQDWSGTPAKDRIALCRRVEHLMTTRRDELAVWQVLELGKNWREADADVAEAIDFFKFHTQQMEQLDGWHATARSPFELNHVRYEPYGVVVVAAPQTLSLAALANMTAAALVAGNTVLVKPSPLMNLVAQGFKRLLDLAGLPLSVCQFLPGRDLVLRDYLVGHPEVDVIAFTGPRTAGLEMLRNARLAAPEQTRGKHFVGDMGGKTVILVDEDADLDEAILRILFSAFGFQGQRLANSAQVIVVGRRHDPLVERLAATLSGFTYGPPENPAHLFGPMINQEACEKALGYIELGKREGTLAFLGKVPEPGFYCPPALVTEITPQHRLAQENILGPILPVLRARRFEEALAFAAQAENTLLGVVFSRLPEHIRLARERLKVRDLHLHCRTSVAGLGMQPFADARLFGANRPAGGADYLKQFLWSRTLSEPPWRGEPLNP
jgi:RHH-type proline utilization regulon transcriptional repressor/proline dehydrogenase/delta 1-pyrroline-5-carboxylate dehydrogenase